jgi:transcriptional regulator with XRE-family HTH domain
MSQKLLQAAGTALWGPQYRSEMARQLGRNLRTVMRWDSGERPVPKDALARLADLLKIRAVEIIEVRRKLRGK